MGNGAPRSKITNVPGWETEAEQYHLLTLAKGVPDNGVIVEIGAEFGMSASIFIVGTNLTHHIYSIDLFPGDLLQVHQQNLASAGFAGRSMQIPGDSTEIGITWPDRFQSKFHADIDLLFVDGDHSYNGVKRDIETWLQYVKVGGVVAFHDCACTTNLMPHVLHFDVTRAISEWYQREGENWQSLGSVDSILSFRRIK